MQVVVNGGLQTAADARRELAFADGAMLGRAVVRNPMLLADASREIFGEAGRPREWRRWSAGWLWRWSRIRASGGARWRPWPGWGTESKTPRVPRRAGANACGEGVDAAETAFAALADD